MTAATETGIDGIGRRSRRTARRAVAPSRAKSRNADATRDQILRVAYSEFARHGFAGARVDRITRLARVNARMIYHYFKSKEGLYHAVLFEAYKDIRQKEASLSIEDLGPVDGILALFDFTFKHFAVNPQFISLLANENLMRGKFVLSSAAVTDVTSPLRTSLERLVAREIATGELAPGLSAVQIYVTIASLSWFHLSNAYTLSAMFGQDLTRPAWREQRRIEARKVLVAYLRAQDAEGVVQKQPSGAPRVRRRQSRG